MAEETTPAEGQGQQVQVMLDDRDLQIVYANAYRINNAPEEVVVDLGFNMLNPNVQPGQGGPQQVLFKVTHRVAMSYTNAKRLTVSLGQFIKRFEQQYGEIPLTPGPKK